MSESIPYQRLCTEFYDLDKPSVPKEALQFYLSYARDANGPLLEPMCGTGRFLIPLLEEGYSVTGFDASPHMIKVCQKKCASKNLKAELLETTFETFSTSQKYPFIFIPSGSLGLLIASQQISTALALIFELLPSKGKFVFELETVQSAQVSLNNWQGHWIERSEGSLIVLNTLSRFDTSSKISTTLCRYELWENNSISSVEVEEFRLRLYEREEFDKILKQHGFIISKKWDGDNYLKKALSSSTKTIIYECIKP